MQRTDSAGPASGLLLSGAHDPAIPSAGLTVDSPLGPVDTVALDRARHGQRTPLTPAERAALWALILTGDTTRTAAARALRMTGSTVRDHLAAYAREQVTA